jgi:hypothetical protein
VTVFPSHEADSAILSEDRRYRYSLTRELSLFTPGAEGTVLFVMLNPSTADASIDDPTIRRCIGFARTWGFARLTVGNLYALRATDPRELASDADPIGPENDRWLAELAASARQVVYAWGANPMAALRAADARRIIECIAAPPVCLGRTKHGDPRHPLYVPKTTERIYA